MDRLIGQRFNLISKSEIRYVGTLHEINPEESTIALENVYSFGTESRKVDNFIPASNRKFDYIVFRGGDVKDIKIVEEQEENEQPAPPNVPNDPAILNASRPGGHGPGPGPVSMPPPHSRGESPFHPPPGYGPPPSFGGYYPPPQFGRGFGPPPGQFGPGPGFHPYGPPPPGYFGGPPGQGFPHSPQFPPQHLSQPPIGPPDQQPQPPQRAPQQQRAPVPEIPTPELPVDNKPASQIADPTSQLTSSKPDGSATKPAEQHQVAPQSRPTPSQSAPPSKPTTILKNNNKVTPAVPFQVNRQSFVPPAPATNVDAAKSDTSKPVGQAPPPQKDMEEASRQAKEAVAAAMAKLNPPPAISARPAPPTTTAASVDALARKIGAMGTSDGSRGRGRGGYRGDRGNGFRRGSGGQHRKIEIPQSDYDFEEANAKFNKEDLIKEAIASGSPIEAPVDSTNGGEDDTVPTPSSKDTISLPTAQVYNKSSSFFDNISSESKDRQQGFEAGGREVRGQEYKKNMETFGQGNVDGYRGRGRGYGRGRPFRGRGSRGNFARGRGGQNSQPEAAGLGSTY